MVASESLVHVLLVSFHGQGHINPLLRLGKRLASKGLLVTFAAPERVEKQMRNANTIVDNESIPVGDGFIRFEFFKEDDPKRSVFDDMAQLEHIGKREISEMVMRNKEEGRQVSCLINNPFIPWVSDVAENLGSTDTDMDTGKRDTWTRRNGIILKFPMYKMKFRVRNVKCPKRFRNGKRRLNEVSVLPSLWAIKPPPPGESGSNVALLPEEILEKAGDRGKIVQWSPQEKVLAHESIACFVTHCGWNSTIEALSSGVPVVCYPQWGDQVTDAKYLVDVFKVGVRMCRGLAENKLITRDVVEKCLLEATVGPQAEEMRQNALKWKEAAEAAVAEGGSSEKNIQNFVDEIKGKEECCSSLQ